MKKIFFGLFIVALTVIFSSRLFAGPPGQEAAVRPELPAIYQKWIDEEVPYIITHEERDVFLKLRTDKEREMFIECFWKQRDWNPATPENEFKTEYYRRLDFANHTFGTPLVPGWKTEKGKIYIIVGGDFEKMMKLRVFEGIREKHGEPAQAVSASFLKHKLSANIVSEDNLEEEQKQIRKTFNLTDVRLLTEASLRWKSDGTEKASHLFRLDGRVYEVLIESENVLVDEFRIQVNEQTLAEKVNLLDTEFTIPRKNIAVFGFENSLGNPYFLSLSTEAVGFPSGAYELNKPPRLIKKVEPVYPEEARKAGIEGTVILKARTDIHGRITNIKVEKSANPLLDQVAVEALRQWVYEPAIIDGKPQTAEFDVNLRFALDKDKKGVVGGVAGGVVGRVEGGVEGGVKGGVRGGVEGGVKGGVQGGVVGGVEGGVLGEVQSDEMEKQKQEIEKDAVRAIGDIKRPKLIKTVWPVYPEIARQAKVEGVVILEIKTDEDGRVMATRVLRSVPLLDQAAIDAVKQWVYEPKLIDGKPRKILFTETVSFKLDEKDVEEFSKGAVKVKDDIPPPELITRVDPVYPEVARQAGVAGAVILQVRTDVKGRVKDVMVLRSIPLLNKAAIDAVRKWVYEPLLIDGEPREAVFTVTVSFALK
jgi:TonB family protein